MPKVFCVEKLMPGLGSKKVSPDWEKRLWYSRAHSKAKGVDGIWTSPCDEQ